ncbi:MAG: helix-turn-helix domain-containing protein [Fusobacteriaceae bacterium]|jgi:transcriptional regulator with XRE-family HTH domain|nr:helix-turn-helix domain-containing protein [Fusobacteriaceae bacterium]
MFLSPGEKILNLRKKYKITQVELSEGVISRTSLGMIETGKRTLSQDLAKGLCENLSKILKTREIEDEIDIANVLKGKDIQAIEYLEYTINATNTEIKDRMWNNDEALAIIDDEKKIYYSKKIYRRFFKFEDYINAKRYLIYSLHYINNTEIKPEIIEDIYNLFSINIVQKEYKEIVEIYQNLSEILREQKGFTSLYVEIKIMYAIALTECKRSAEAIDFLQYNMKKSKTDEEFYLYRKNLANLYNILNQYDRAVFEYVSLAKGKSKEVKASLYGCALEIGLDIGDEDVVKKYYGRTKSIYEEIKFESEIDEYRVLIVLAECSMYLNNMDVAKGYVLKAFYLGKNFPSEIDNQMKLIKLAFEIFEVKDFNYVKKMEDEYCQLIKIKENYKPAISILNFYKKWMPIELEKKFMEYK